MIALAPSHKNQLGNYKSWLEKRGLAYKILREGDVVSSFSMLILCGGPDVGSAKKRDQLELAWFKEAYGKIPVLGICRGLQLANVALGGTLYEDLSTEKVFHASNKIEIAGEPRPLLESSWHDVSVGDENGIREKLRVNSRHHQGIKQLAPGLTSLAICEEDGLIEMARGDKALFVQWHPEREDVWGTRAEEIVYQWVTENYRDSSTIDMIISYMRSKGFTVVSNERIRKSIDPSMSDSKINSLISENSSLKKVTDKHGRSAVKLINL